MDLSTFTSIFLRNEFFASYIRLLSALVFISLNGLIIFAALFKTSNRFLAAGGAMITGSLGFLLILSTFSYIYKGPISIILYFFLYAIFCIFVLYRYFPRFNHIFSSNIALKAIITTYIFNLCIFLLPFQHVVLLILALYLIYIRSIFKQKKDVVKSNSSSFFLNLFTFIYVSLIFLRGGSSTVAGDAFTYWGIATSFARGNYPTVLPWQPDFLTVYHEGTFIVEGALHSLANMSISVTQGFFSSYIMIAIFLFVTGMAREKTKSLFCFLPAIFGLILFGGPIFLVGEYQKFLSSFINPPIEALFKLSQMYHFADIKMSWGGGATSIDGLFYINFHAFGLAAFFLILFAMYYYSQKRLSIKDDIVLVILSALCLSVDETLFIPAALVIGVYILNRLKKISFKKAFFHSLILFLIGILMFFIIQNLFRDSLLTPSPEQSRFKLLKPNSHEFIGAFNYGKSILTPYIQNQSVWYMFNLTTITIFTFLTGILLRSLFITSIAASALISSFTGYFADNTYVSSTGIRFLNQSYNLTMFAIGFILISLRDFKLPTTIVKIFSLTLQKWKINLASFKLGLIIKAMLPKAIALFLAIIFLPQIFTSHARFITESVTNDYYNYIYRIDYHLPPHEWIKKNLPYDARIIFIDEYPAKAKSSHATDTALMLYGFFVPSAPAKYKVLQADVGNEWYDAIISLDPQSLNELKVDYLFVYYNSLYRFPQSKVELLSNSKYFEKTYDSIDGALLKVTPLYKSLVDKESNSIRNIVAMVPDGKRVYLEKFEMMEMRRGLILALSKKTQLYGPKYGHAGDYFGLIETETPFTPVENLSEMDDIDYVVTPKEKNAPKFSNYTFSIVAQNPYFTLWKKD